MAVASVVFASPLPQLDKTFDYSIPEHLIGKIQFGIQVSVPFGKSKKAKTGIVVAVQEASEFTGTTLDVIDVVSKFPTLTKQQYALCKAVATRQAGQTGELMVTAVPKRSVRAESKYQIIARGSETIPDVGKRTPDRTFTTPALYHNSASNSWVANFIARARVQIDLGKSVLVVLPDYRDVEKFEAGLISSDLLTHSIDISSNDSLVERWTAHLKAINETATIVYGTRSTIFAPCQNLGAILIWDDGDESHTEQSSPYWTTRDVALQRSELETCELHFSSHSPSAEICRLIEIGYLDFEKLPNSKGLVRLTESTTRLDDESFALVSSTLAKGKPVLVQVATKGFANALACVSCKEVRRCSDCESALWLDNNRVLRCRSCKRSSTESCKCGGKTLRPISVGSNALAEQLARSYPNATVVHSSGVERTTRIERNGTLVIATPGAEPEVDGGYELAVFVDAWSMVGMPVLRSLESSCQKWANALSTCAPSAIAIFVGLRGSLTDDIKNLDFFGIVRKDMLERSELGLPPSTRVITITSSNSVDKTRIEEQVALALPELIQLPANNGNVVAYSYSIASGSTVASTIKEIAQRASASSKSKIPGQRVYFIKMDDYKVI